MSIDYVNFAMTKTPHVWAPSFGDEFDFLPKDWTTAERECVFYLPYFYEDKRGIFFTSDVPHVMAAIAAWQRNIFLGGYANLGELVDFLGISVPHQEYVDTLTFAHMLEDGFYIDVGIGEKINGVRDLHFISDPITVDEYNHKNDRYY